MPQLSQIRVDESELVPLLHYFNPRDEPADAFSAENGFIRLHGQDAAAVLDGRLLVLSALVLIVAAVLRRRGAAYIRTLVVGVTLLLAAVATIRVVREANPVRAFVMKGAAGEAGPQRSRVIDIFSYGGRQYDRTLELRLRELADLVDVFVVLEMGRPLSTNAAVAPGSFNKSAPAFRPYAAQILHVDLAPYAHLLLRAADSSAGASQLQWRPAKQNEYTMRTLGVAMAYRMLAQGAPHGAGSAPDRVILSDIDEIPRARALRRLLGDRVVAAHLAAGHVYALEGPSFYYDVECRVAESHDEARWNVGPRLVGAPTLIDTSWDEVRKQRCKHAGCAGLASSLRVHVEADGAWHFGYLMTPREIVVKLCTNTDPVVQMHCRSSKTLATLRERVTACKDPFDRGTPMVVALAKGNELPRYALEHIERFGRGSSLSIEAAEEVTEEAAEAARATEGPAARKQGTRGKAKGKKGLLQASLQLGRT